MKIIIKNDHSSGLKKGDKYDNLPEHVSEALVREGVAEEAKHEEPKKDEKSVSGEPLEEVKEEKSAAKRKTKEEKHSDTHTK